MQEMIEQFAETIRTAAEYREPLCIRGSGSKDFYGGVPSGAVLDVTPYRGIVAYEPKELVLTARAGTPLVEIEQVLAENNQMLPFEPPLFGPGATLGGCIASGLSGPRRAYQGSVRDFVLGARILDGNGDDLVFGGQVMKNVAGYDVSRLMVGAMGTLGVLLEVSLKVLPRPMEEVTLHFDMDEKQAIEAMNRWAGQPVPLSATAYSSNELALRLSGSASAVAAARSMLGGAELVDGALYWKNVREQTSAFFKTDSPLWRISLPSTAPTLNLSGAQLIEWGGALRWCVTEADAASVCQIANSAGGQATLFRGVDKSQGVFHPLSPALMKIHKKLKQAFDPKGILNPGRMYDF